MAIIKSAREIAMEKTKNIEILSPQEINEIKQQEKINHILAEYYKDKIGSDDLWQHFKELPDQHLTSAQSNLLQSMTFRSNAYEMEKRKNGILAVEHLKESNQLSEIELNLKELIKIQEDYQRDKEQVIQHLREELERDPRKRLQAFQQGNQVMIKEMGIEEALEQNKELNQQLKQVEKKTRKKFDMVKDKLTELINN